VQVSGAGASWCVLLPLRRTSGGVDAFGGRITSRERSALTGVMGGVCYGVP
jgi:hypothetical protein